MVRQLRQRGRTQRTNGLVLANGGTLTHENAVCLSNTPLEPHRAYPQYQVDVKGNKLDGVPAICLTPQGEARVEVLHDLHQPMIHKLSRIDVYRGIRQAE